MNDLRSAAQQALEALEEINRWSVSREHAQIISEEAITALKSALAEQVQEPVAWIHTDPDKPRVKFLEWREDEPGYRGCWIKTPLYTALRAALAEPVQAESITDAMMNVVDRLGGEYDQVDPRAWQHLLVYAPKGEPVQESTCAAPLACSGIDKCVFRYNAQFPPVNTLTIGCNVCGLKAQTWGYVCPRSDCPTKVTC